MRTYHLARICDDLYDRLFSLPTGKDPRERMGELGDSGFIVFTVDDAELVRVYSLVRIGWPSLPTRCPQYETGGIGSSLKALYGDLESNVRARPNYTVRRAAEDWLKEGLDGRSAKTIEKNEQGIPQLDISGDTGITSLIRLATRQLH